MKRLKGKVGILIGGIALAVTLVVSNNTPNYTDNETEVINGFEQTFHNGVMHIVEKPSYQLRYTYAIYTRDSIDSPWSEEPTEIVESDVGLASNALTRYVYLESKYENVIDESVEKQPSL